MYKFLPFKNNSPKKLEIIGSTTLLETVLKTRIFHLGTLAILKKLRSWQARITTSVSPVRFTLLAEILYSLQAQVTAPGGQNHQILLTSQFYLVG
jgi:hypothetical protein